MVQMFQDLGIRTKILLCASVILVTVMIMAGIVYNEIVRSQQRDQAVLLTIEVINNTDALLARLDSVETGYRSFLITGKATFLEPFANAYLESITLRQQLYRQVSEDPDQVKLMRQIDQMVEAWRNDLLIPGIAQRQDVKVEDASTLNTQNRLADESKHAFDRLRALVNRFRDIEAKHVDTRRLEAQAVAANLKATLLWGTIIVAFGSLGMLWLLASNIAQRVGRVTRAATRMSQGDLGSRCDLPPAGDEVGRMAITFNTMSAALQQHTSDLQVQYLTAEVSRTEAEQARAQLAAQLAVIEEQQNIIREMSVPVLPLTSTTLMMPLVGALDSSRLALVQSQALGALERSGARQLILDITGVPVIDTQIAQGLLHTVQMARLLGSRVLVVGIRPEVAQALVGLGLDFRHLQRYSTLQQGVAHALMSDMVATQKESQI
jgi:CHASE3 domain sensor protein/anti-anti-sigma regulatory factor